MDSHPSPVAPSMDGPTSDARGSVSPPGSATVHQTTVLMPIENQLGENQNLIQGTHGTYELDDQPFARGNYAGVFKARETTTNAVSACKVINLHQRSFNEEEHDSIETEIAILSLMHHENIIAFVDRHRTPDFVYIFSEFAPGTTLVEYYRNNNNYLTELDARFIFRQVCHAVDYMHKNGIIHRDIKSENIVVDEDLKVKLVDFGLAQRTNGLHVLTSRCGTESYMAPEIRAGNKSNGYTSMVDIWSLGVLLFRMLVGKYPFNDDLYDNLVNKGVEDEEDQRMNLDYLKRDWRQFVDRQSKRSPEVKYLLDEILVIDPSCRARMDQILTSDWMRMIDEMLADLDRIERSGSTAIFNTSKVSSSGDGTTQVNQKPWGALVIAPGGFPDAPRYIELKESRYVLGRVDDKKVNVLLGSRRAISVKHCIIERDDDGVVMMSNTSLNGTYINNLHYLKMRSGQLFSGDVLGIVVCAGHAGAPKNTSMGCLYCLKYNVELYDAEAPTPEQLACRLYTDHTHRGHKKRRPKDRTPDESMPIWGKLKRLNVVTQMEELQAERTIMGRDKECDIVISSQVVSRRHCAIEWVAEERKAYLTNLSPGGTVVNDETFEGRLQLRNRDEIRLVVTSWETGKERIEVGYKFVQLSKGEIPSMKRVKNAPVDIPEPILQFGESSTLGGEEVIFEKESTVEEEEEEEGNENSVDGLRIVDDEEEFASHGQTNQHSD
ncbi:hypothetical protein EMPS_05463 [Entomortierella parvispora]|uniref:Uncharacterized protein n=1 Tax=Entomortierella parvispora TaxID=205924 RepID=A0A9P3LWS1_9FUNG|nr:hypothetical protein EMPS_05463 [Entomortierella parvispora]